MSFIKKIFSSRPLNLDTGLFLLRLGVGLSFLLFHGYGKLTGGAERWASLGGNMSTLGITFVPAFWGFMAAFSEFFCAMFIVLGVAVRPAAALLGFTMFVAMLRHLGLPADANGAGWSGASHAMEMLAVCLCLLMTGPGRFTLSMLWSRGKSQ